jgi:TRAP-type mannitol/chloroaromatic compound transport system substrate-binding protein
VRRHVKKIALLSVVAAALFANAAAVAQTFNWKMAASYPGGPWVDRDAKGFAERVRQLTDGRVNITVFPGGSLGNPLKVTETVRSGVAEAGFNSPHYDWGVDKTAALLGGAVGGLRTPEEYILWLYHGGGLELFQSFRDERFDVVSIPCTSPATEIFLHSRKPVRTLADFKGLKLRTAGAWAEIATRLGASTVVLPGGEVYSALERGVIDAAEWSSPETNLPAGFHKIAKYIITPGVHFPGGILECQFNKAAWAKLTKRDQDLIRLAGKLSTLESWVNSSAADMDAYKTLKASAEVIHLSPEFIEATNVAAAKWTEEQAAVNPWVKKVWTSMTQFKEKLTIWPEYRQMIGGSKAAK